jgi:phosphoribosylanthranilate isomerase
MIDGIRIKVCGLTSIVDAEFADRCGADYLGFIFYPKSPRYLPLATFDAMRFRLPDRKKVAVSVEPSAKELGEMSALGFDFFQIHFRHDLPLATIGDWSKAVGGDRLWLAPKLPPGVDVSPDLMPYGKYFLLDTFHAEKFGGTGETGDWGKFSSHQDAHADKTWILSGGLSPENIGDALRQSGARFVDVNSGVESAPGVKDQAKLKRFVVRLHESRV